MKPLQNAAWVLAAGANSSPFCPLFQFQLLPSALFKSSSDFIPLGKTPSSSSSSLNLPLIGGA